MSSEEINVKNAVAAQKECRQRNRFSGELYDEISEWQLSEKKRKKAEANRRYRARQKLLKPPTESRAKSAAEYNRRYRERKKLKQAEAETTTSSVSSKITKAVNRDPEPDQYEAEIRYQKILAKQTRLQNAKNKQETHASDINRENIEEIQLDSDDSDAPLKRRKVTWSSSSEINFDELEEAFTEYSRSTENQSGSDSISTSDIVPLTEELEQTAETAKRFRLTNKILKPMKPLPLTASERSKAYRERQKSLQNHAAKILTTVSKDNFNENEEVNDDASQNGRRPKAPPKTSAQKSKDYRERKRSLILAAFGDKPTRRRRAENLNEATTSDNNEDDKESSYSGSKKHLRFVLTQDERVAVITQFNTEQNYEKIALDFNCSVEQVKSVVSNRKAILEFNESTINLSKQGNEAHELRRRKLNLFAYCLYEYTQRAEYHFKAHITEEMVHERAIEFRNLMGIDGFTPDQSWINQFMAAYNVNSPNTSINTTQRPRISLDVGNIMSHCVRHSAMASTNLQPKIPETLNITLVLKDAETKGYSSGKNQGTPETFKLNIRQVPSDAETPGNTAGQNQGTSEEFESIDDDDCVAIVKDSNDDLNNSPRTPAMASNLQPKIPENYKLNMRQVLNDAETPGNSSGQNPGTSEEFVSVDDDDCVAIVTDSKDDLNNPPRTQSIEEFSDNIQQSSLKIEKLHHSPIHIADYQVVKVEMPEIKAAPSLCHDSAEASDEAPLPRCVESFKDALRLLKPLEDFALMRESYRVIGLLSQLEQIFEAGKKSEERVSSIK